MFMVDHQLALKSQVRDESAIICMAAPPTPKSDIGDLSKIRRFSQPMKL
jgi:hypothetical protein